MLVRGAPAQKSGTLRVTPISHPSCLVSHNSEGGKDCESYPSCTTAIFLSLDPCFPGWSGTSEVIQTLRE